MSHIVKVKAECIDKSKILSNLMVRKDQILERIISLENLNEPEVDQICFGVELDKIKIWIEDLNQSSKIFETTIGDIVFDDEEVFTFFDIPIMRKQEIFDLSKVNRLSGRACVVKKDSEVLRILENYSSADKFARSVEADMIEIFGLYLQKGEIR